MTSTRERRRPLGLCRRSGQRGGMGAHGHGVEPEELREHAGHRLARGDLDLVVRDPLEEKLMSEPVTPPPFRFA